MYMVNYLKTWRKMQPELLIIKSFNIDGDKSCYFSVSTNGHIYLNAQKGYGFSSGEPLTKQQKKEDYPLVIIRTVGV